MEDTIMKHVLAVFFVLVLILSPCLSAAQDQPTSSQEQTASQSPAANPVEKPEILKCTIYDGFILSANTPDPSDSVFKDINIKDLYEGSKTALSTLNGCKGEVNVGFAKSSKNKPLMSTNVT